MNSSWNRYHRLFDCPVCTLLTGWDAMILEYNIEIVLFLTYHEYKVWKAGERERYI